MKRVPIELREDVRKIMRVAPFNRRMPCSPWYEELCLSVHRQLRDLFMSNDYNDDLNDMRAGIRAELERSKL